MTGEAERRITWARALRVVVKAGVLFALCNLTFALALPMETLGRLSLYNIVVPGRVRLPYGETPATDYNLTLANIPAMFASHQISAGAPDNALRVVVLGDSAVWGWLLPPDHTLTAQLNALDLRAPDGRRLHFYNLGYPERALTKDLLLLDEALGYAPDAILWLVTLDAFAPDAQMASLVAANGARTADLVARYPAAFAGFEVGVAQPAPGWLDRTLIAQRRPLADWLRLQTVGFAWWATGIDQAIPETYTPRAVDLDADQGWNRFESPVELAADDLALGLLDAGAALAGDLPVLVVNEPIFISDGQNSDLRYNSWYPRWAYDAYRALLAGRATNADWAYLDLWDAVAPDEFTDSPVHLSAAGNAVLAGRLAPEILRIINPQ